MIFILSCVAGLLLSGILVLIGNSIKAKEYKRLRNMRQHRDSINNQLKQDVERLQRLHDKQKRKELEQKTREQYKQRVESKRRG